MQSSESRKFPSSTLAKKALSTASLLAAKRGSHEISSEDLLAGCLQALSRFGVALISDLAIDLDQLGLPYLPGAEPPAGRPEYSHDALATLQRAGELAAAENVGELEVEHILACFSETGTGLMAQLKETLGIGGTHWRVALARHYAQRLTSERAVASPRLDSRVILRGPTPEYLSPEEAAVLLGIHVQTLRAYIRAGKLPALRVAGERVLRIRSADLRVLLEPLQPEP